MTHFMKSSTLYDDFKWNILESFRNHQKTYNFKTIFDWNFWNYQNSPENRL